MTLPKVSVVTCSYNRPDMLGAAIASLRAQTDPDWEHLIFDDASTDPRVTEILRWALKDPRVRVWRGQRNMDRPSALWNFMLDRAHGRYLTVLDDDNEKLPQFIEIMSRELERDANLDVVTCGWRVDQTSPPKSEDYHLNLRTSADQLRTLSTCDGGAMLYRRSVFERAGYFAEDLRTSEDWDWLRRAVAVGSIKNLPDVLATYRTHGTNRMWRAQSLGVHGDMSRVMSRSLGGDFGVTLALPPRERLTASQRDVCDGVARGLRDIPWVQEGRDVVMVVAPFQQSADEITAAARGCGKIVSLHMEDPYAVETNLERVRAMAGVAETWVCTNDAATIGRYRQVVGNRVIVCPSLAADGSQKVDKRTRDIDVLLCGYAYPSRRAFVESLMPLLGGLRVALVGDGWDTLPVAAAARVLRTQSLAETYALHAEARAVVCLHRVHGDCSDGPTKPITVNRGALEGYAGARVFLDRTRPNHCFDRGDVVWYSPAQPRALAAKLRDYLSKPDDGLAERFAQKCRLLYTHRARLARVLNCVRAPRHLAEIP